MVAEFQKLLFAGGFGVIVGVGVLIALASVFDFDGEVIIDLPGDAAKITVRTADRRY